MIKTMIIEIKLNVTINLRVLRNEPYSYPEINSTKTLKGEQ